MSSHFKSILKWLIVGLSLSFLLISVIFIWAHISTEARLHKVYTVSHVLQVSIPSDPTSLDRGKHLITSVTACTNCHGADLGGATETVVPLILTIRGPNLTLGEGSVTKNYTNEDWVKAIQHGIHPDGTPLIIMPSHFYANLSPNDLGAIIAAIRSYPPVNRKVAPPTIGPVGRVLMWLNKASFLAAERIDHNHSNINNIEMKPGVEYGRYLVQVGGCQECHGANLTGGRIPGTPPSIPPAPNLTLQGPLAQWSEADFIQLFRTGKRPDGTELHEIMPWKAIGHSTDEELKSIFKYLRTFDSEDRGKRKTSE